MNQKAIKLPESWSSEKVEKLCAFNPKHDRDISDEIVISFVPMSALDEKTGRIRDKEYKHLGEVKKGYTHFADGDIIFAKITPCMENGKSAVASNLVNGLACGSTEFHVLRSYGALVPQYLHYFLRQRSYLEIASGAMTGVVGQRRLPKEFLLETNIPLPPLSEQKRIVAKIEELNDRTQKAKEALEAIPQLCDRFRQSVLAAAFRGDLTADWREQNPDVEPASTILNKFLSGNLNKNQRITSLKVNTEDSNSFSTIPETWSYTNLDNICNKITDGEHLTPPLDNRGIPLLSAKDVRDGYLDFSNTKFVSAEFAYQSRSRCDPELDDILVVSRGATVGRSCKVNTDKVFCLMGSVLLFKLKTFIVAPSLIDYFFKSPLANKSLSSISGASAQQAIYIRDMRNFVVPIPPLLEQQEIVHRIESIFKIIDEIEKQYQQAKVRLDQLNQSILAKAFRGELVPQDPEEEPASILLERIRAEREQLNNSKPKSNPTSKGKRNSKIPEGQESIPGLE